jgi:hypothetical protein
MTDDEQLRLLLAGQNPELVALEREQLLKGKPKEESRNGSQPEDPEPPSDESTDGATLLDELRNTLTRYVIFPSNHAASATALWIAATHTLPAFECAPRLVITSPGKRCGKTRLLDIIDGTCYRPLSTVDATVAAIFRSLGGKHPRTLLIDEADAIFGTKKAAEQNEDLRKLLNAGHQRGRPALRCVGPNQKPTQFDTFAMAAIAGIGAMPDTITDRAVNIQMSRRSQSEPVAKFRSRRDGPLLNQLRERLSAWASPRIKELSTIEPVMPVEDRAADTWEPLICIADAAGGHWPNTARAACIALVEASDESDEDKSLDAKLLVDIQQIFSDKKTSFLESQHLVDELRSIEESPWKDFDLTPNKLAYRLRDFKVKPRRNPAGTARGYTLESFIDSFERYIRQKPSNVRNSTSEGDGSNPSDGLDRQTPQTVRTVSADQTLSSDGLTVSDDYATENDAGSPPNGFSARTRTRARAKAINEDDTFDPAPYDEATKRDTDRMYDQ